MYCSVIFTVIVLLLGNHDKYTEQTWGAFVRLLAGCQWGDRGSPFLLINPLDIPWFLLTVASKELNSWDWSLFLSEVLQQDVRCMFPLTSARFVWALLLSPQRQCTIGCCKVLQVSMYSYIRLQKGVNSVMDRRLKTADSTCASWCFHVYGDCKIHD